MAAAAAVSPRLDSIRDQEKHRTVCSYRNAVKNATGNYLEQVSYSVVQESYVETMESRTVYRAEKVCLCTDSLSLWERD